VVAADACAGGEVLMLGYFFFFNSKEQHKICKKIYKKNKIKQRVPKHRDIQLVWLVAHQAHQIGINKTLLTTLQRNFTVHENKSRCRPKE